MYSAIKKAKDLWVDPSELARLWEEDSNKFENELLIRDIVGKPNKIVDLGCGIGRFSNVLDYKEYKGYDQSQAMIHIAKREYPTKDFACVDIFNYQNNEHYDTAICIDVLYHQEDPLGCLDRLLSLWDAKTYVFSLLVGNTEERLYNSHVVSFLNVSRVFGKYPFSIIHMHTDDNPFVWTVLKYEK